MKALSAKSKRGDRVDKEKLGRYAELYSTVVYRAAYSYTRNHADSEDIMQEAFMRLYRAEDSFESDENVKAWLIRVAINISKDYLKSPWIHKRAELDSGITYEGVEDRELDEAMDKLKPDYRTAVFLRYYMGYSVKETAEILGISETNAKARLKRAREKLKTLLTDEI